MLSGLLVVLLVEAPHQLLKDRAHGVVVESGLKLVALSVANRLRAEVDRRVEQFVDQVTERVGFREPRDLVAELEVVEDLLDVGREAIEVGDEVGSQLLAVGAVAEILESELRVVVEGLFGSIAQRLVLVVDPRLVKQGFGLQNRLLGRFEHRVEAAQHDHGQDHVAVLAPHVEVAQNVVGYRPDEVDDLVVLAGVHLIPALAMSSGERSEAAVVRAAS